jgi:alkylresorcinol/alkylpyrone synthase
MASLAAFTVLVLLVGVERLAELVVSKRNAAWSFARGGQEYGFGHYPAMVVLHTGLLAGALAEAWIRRPDVADAAPVGPHVLASRSRLYPDSERAMGWDVGATGLRIVLDAQVPELVETYVGDDVDEFLRDHGLGRDDVEWYVAHPGGPKVLEALQAALGVDREALQVTWDSLAAIGNLSSSSVLHVLADTLATRPPRPGSYGLMLAMGPGFCSELVLLRAPEAAA